MKDQEQTEGRKIAIEDEFEHLTGKSLPDNQQF
jgi:hypothetical protein